MVCFPAVVSSFSNIAVEKPKLIYFDLILLQTGPTFSIIYLFACGLLVTSRYYIVHVLAGPWCLRGSHGCRPRRVGADLRLDILSVTKSEIMARSPPRTLQVQVARHGIMILC